MVAIDFNLTQEGIINAIKDVCSILEYTHQVDGDFVPGNYIMSQVLISFTSQIEVNLSIEIPEQVYIFYDCKNKIQLSIKEATQKLIHILKKGKKNDNRKRTNS